MILLGFVAPSEMDDNLSFMVTVALLDPDLTFGDTAELDDALVQARGRLSLFFELC